MSQAPRFDDLVLAWASAACRDWGYPDLPSDFIEGVRKRLPSGVREALAVGLEQGAIISTGGHKFTLKDLASGKGPYAWFSKSDRLVPAPNWEYFVQAAEYARLYHSLASKDYQLVFEDDLMDIAVYQGGKLLVCVEVKEKASQLPPLIAAIRSYEGGFDASSPDRGNDGLRKAKYLVRSRPSFFALVAIGGRLEFNVSHPAPGQFILTDDVIPIW